MLTGEIKAALVEARCFIKLFGGLREGVEGCRFPLLAADASLWNTPLQHAAAPPLASRILITPFSAGAC